MIDKTAELCRKQKIIIPTIAQMKDPATIPASIQNRLADVGLWDLDPANLFRVTWKNEPVSHGGGFNLGNWIEFPSALTGVPARIIGLCGKYFPTGSHKVGAAFGCSDWGSRVLAERRVGSWTFSNRSASHLSLPHPSQAAVSIYPWWSSFWYSPTL